MKARRFGPFSGVLLLVSVGYAVEFLPSWRARGKAMVFLAPVLLLLLSGCGERRPTVDMSPDRVEDESETLITDQRPILRVAVGAMISPEITREYYQDLIELVAARIGRRATFYQRRTYAEVNELVADRKVDVAFVCAGPYTQGHEDFGMELLVMPVVHGKSVYHGYILAHRDSDVESLDDLEGRTFALTDPDSNTGWLVPRYMLSRRGETLESFFGDTFFTHSHDNSIKAVANGLADGAAVDSLIWEFVNTVDSTDTVRTKIVEKSPAYGIPPIVVHPDLDDDLKRRLKSAFLTIHEDTKAASLLALIQIDRFSESQDSMYDSVREMRAWIENSDTAKTD